MGVRASQISVYRQWFASKMKPKKYGDRITQEHTGLGGGPIQNTWVVNPVKAYRIGIEHAAMVRLSRFGETRQQRGSDKPA